MQLAFKQPHNRAESYFHNRIICIKMKSTYKKINLALDNTILIVLICFIYFYLSIYIYLSIYLGKILACLKCPENKIYTRKRGQIGLEYLVENTDSTENSKTVKQ